MNDILHVIKHKIPKKYLIIEIHEMQQSTAKGTVLTNILALLCINILRLFKNSAGICSKHFLKFFCMITNHMT